MTENGTRREVKGTYVINGNEVKFKLETFDSSKPLVIDPVLSYSTLLGSGNNDLLPASQSILREAHTLPARPTYRLSHHARSFQIYSTHGGAFVTKLDPTGSTLIYSTYLNSNETATRMDWVSRWTQPEMLTSPEAQRGSDFPVVNGLKTTSNFFKTTDAAANWNNQNTGIAGDVNAIAVAPSAPNTIYAAATDEFYLSTRWRSDLDQDNKHELAQLRISPPRWRSIPPTLQLSTWDIFSVSSSQPMAATTGRSIIPTRSTSDLYFPSCSIRQRLRRCMLVRAMVCLRVRTAAAPGSSKTTSA